MLIRGGEERGSVAGEGPGQFVEPQVRSEAAGGGGIEGVGLILDYSAVSRVGVWTGSAYDGVTGLVKSGLVRSSASGTLTLSEFAT